MHPPTPESRSRLLSQVRADQSERWRRGEPARVEEYLARHPDLDADAEAVLVLIGLELLHRREAGERPDLEEYQRRFPRHADSLRRSWTWLGTGRPESGAATCTAGEPTEAGPRARRPLPPPELPGFELQEKLGEGGMGVVYRARDLRLGQLRAVKVIRAAFAGEVAHERFEREAKAAARMDHPGVVRIYSLGEHAGHLFICMEYLEGGNLHARLRGGPLEFREAAGLVRQLALAVQHAHDQNVLHRDLKPANVLLTSDGQPKIADFGLAKLLDEDTGLTHTGDVMGTPSYMAPEQAEGRSRQVGPPADVWALGAILYECLTGRPPFRGESRSETMDLVRRQPPVAPRRLRPDLPAGLEAVCLRCLAKRPEDRYATAAELADDLQAWLDGKPVRVRTPRKRRAPLVAAVALVVLAGAAAALVPVIRRPVHDAGPPAAESSPVAGAWNPLPVREPEVLKWPAWSKKSYKLYQPDSGELLVSCEGLGLLALGQTDAPRYRLAVTLHQTPWVGNVGVFFGYRDAEGDATAAYQVLELSPAANAPQGRPLRVDWKAVRHVGAGADERQHIRTVGASPSSFLRPTEHRLGLTVGPGGLEEVTLDDKVLPGLRAADVLDPPRPADYKGRFGLYVQTGSGTFREAQYLFHEEP